ncbi:MAG: hypothetical protein AB7P04_13000 [Bacteriovoracia bacterium]
MSGVSPSGDPTYYHDLVANYRRANEDLEEQNKTEREQAAERQEAHNQASERKTKDAIQSIEDSYERTIKNVKRSANETLEDSRNVDREQYQDLKRSTYNRYGAYQNEVNDAKRAVAETEKSWQNVHRQDQEKLQDMEQRHTQSINRMNRQQANELHDAVTRVRDDASEQHAQSVQREREDFYGFRKRIQDTYDQAATELHKDAAKQRNHNLEEIAKLERLGNERADEARLVDERKRADISRTMDHRMGQQLEAQRISHTEEMTDLRGRAKMAADAQANYMRDKNLGRVEAIKDVESDWKMRERQIMDTAMQEKEKLKADVVDTESYLRAQNQSTLSEKDAYFTRVIGRQNAENLKERQELQSTFDRAKGELDLRNQRDREMSAKRLESALDVANQQRNEALADQARQYQETGGRQRQEMRQQIAQLEKKVQVAETTDDPSKISPAAEQAVRRNVIGEYQRIFQADKERNDETMNRLRRGLADDLESEKLRNRSSEMKMSRTHMAEQDAERSQFYAFVQDTEQQTNQKLAMKEDESQRGMEALIRNHTRQSERVRRDTEDRALAQDLNAKARLQSTQQDADFNEKMTHRKHAHELTQQAREFNRAMNLKDEETKRALDDMKHETDKRINDIEREKRLALDSQARTYEQRIKELEASNNERQRVMASNYEDQLERVKQSNARLIQRKS